MLANKLRAGGLAVAISITDQAIALASGGIFSTSASYRLDNNGSVYGGEYTFENLLEQWISQPSRVADYEAKVALVTGTLTGGTVGTWLALSTDRTWYITAAAGNYKTCTFTVEIRRAGVGTVLDSATVILTADAT